MFPEDTVGTILELKTALRPEFALAGVHEVSGFWTTGRFCSSNSGQGISQWQYTCSKIVLSEVLVVRVWPRLSRGRGGQARSWREMCSMCSRLDSEICQKHVEMKNLSLLLERSTWSACIFFGLLMAGSAQGTIIPADRLITWQGNVGVPGGIPNRTNIFCNVKVSIPGTSIVAKGDGITDDTAAIQTALNLCPSNQVVYLPRSTYYVSSTLFLKNGYTVRGDGPGLTTIDAHNTSGSVFALGMDGGSYELYEFSSPTYVANITSGANLGSSNITVSSATGIKVGCLLNIDELNDTNFLGVVPIGNEGFNSDASRGQDGAGTRCLGQVVRVTGVSGTSITFDPPLIWWFTNASPQTVAFTCANSMAGVESLTVNNNNTGVEQCFSMWGVSCCWIKNVESVYADGDHAIVDSSTRCEIRDSYFHDAYLHSSGTHDSTVVLRCHSSGILVENNIMRRLHIGLILETGGGGDVIAYNFMTNQFDSGAINGMYNDIEYHGSHPIMILYEGNVANSFNQDGVWGTGSHGTLLRNFFSGQDWDCPPYTGRGPEQTNSYNKQYQANRCINLAGIGVSKYFNLVGNVLGTATMGNYPSFSPVYVEVAPTTRAYDHEGLILSMGYAGGGDGGTTAGDNNMPWVTLINHGNWDVVNQTQIWSTNIADHTIPNSYYLTAKPAFFGTLAWPPIDPSNATAVSPMNIPAAYRYFYGTNPPAGSINQPPTANASATPTNGPAPLVVSFSSAGSSDPEGATLTYSWAFGDGATSTAANPSHTYINAGTYSAQLSVSDGTNIASSAPMTIRATILGSNQPPVVVASATPTSGVAPLLVTFSGSGSYDPEGAPLTYNWTFGDGTTSTTANPSHTYAAAGTFNATLQASDGTNITSSIPLRITVTNPAPTVLVTSPTNGASYAAPATINLAASVTPNGHTITKVQFYNGAALLGEDTAAPYALTWTNVGPGSYTLTAQAVYDAGATTASPAVSIAVGGLVAAYGFEEGIGSTTADASGNANNGTITGAAWTTAGKYGDALLFNGTNSLVTVNDSPWLDLTTGLTLEAWVYPTALSGWRPIVYKPQGTGLCYVLQGSSGATGVPSLGLSVAPSNLMGPNPLPLNTWSHLAATYDGATMILYVNGVQVASQTQSGALSTSTDPLTIGGNSSGEAFAGIIDEVRIYNRALNASAIQTDMNTPVSPAVPRPPAPTGLHIVGF